MKIIVYLEPEKLAIKLNRKHKKLDKLCLLKQMNSGPF